MNASTAAPKTMPSVTTIAAQPELSPRASPWAMPGSSKENTVAASMTPAAELSSMSRARIDKSLIVKIIKAPSNVPTLTNILTRLPATIILHSYSIMVIKQKYKYVLNRQRVEVQGIAQNASV